MITGGGHPLSSLEIDAASKSSVQGRFQGRYLLVELLDLLFQRRDLSVEPLYGAR